MGGKLVKVELFAKVSSLASAYAVPQQKIMESLSGLDVEVSEFHTVEETQALYQEMAAAFKRKTEIVLIAADETSFLDLKWNLLKLLALQSVVCQPIDGVIREKTDVSDVVRKSHAIMPKDAAIFVTAAGLFSGFAIKRGNQMIVFVPLSEKYTEDILTGLQSFFANKIAPKPKTPVEVPEETEQPEESVRTPLPDNNARFAETAMKLSEQDISVAFAMTQTVRYLQNGVRANPRYGDAFIPAEIQETQVKVEDLIERTATLADEARQEIGTTLGTAISNFRTDSADSEKMFLCLAVTDGKNVFVRQFETLKTASASELVLTATDVLYEFLQGYAAGEPFPPSDVETNPIRLYADSEEEAAFNRKQKRGVAIKIVICVLIALIMCVLIGLYFKDEVAAFFDFSAQQEKITATTLSDEYTTLLPEAETEATTEEESESEVEVDLALFGVAEEAATPGGVEKPAQVFVETPVEIDWDTAVKPYIGAVTTTPESTTKAETTTKVETTTKKETTTAAPTTTTTKVEKTSVVALKPESTTETTTGKATTTTTTTTAPTTTTTKATTTTKPATTTNAVSGLLDTLFQKAEGTYTFKVYGYGHGVGMSQMGALNYSANGWTYSAILDHYYPGTASAKEMCPLTVTYNGKVLETHQFIRRVVQQEIGGYCKTQHTEAIKAQTVAVYSFIKSKNYTLKTGDVAYAECNVSAIVSNAVDAVIGEYRTYGGKVASTQFCASCAGKTTSAKTVWGGNVAYLAGGVDSGEATVLETTVTISAADLKAVVDAYNANNPNSKITLSGSPSQWLEILEHDHARGDVGYVASIRVGDKVMSGNTFRTVFNKYKQSSQAGFKSHCFSMKFN